jgi:F-type H+-transporting ATPase subunit b
MGEAFSALGINLPQVIAQIVNFAILLVVLRFTLYKPILRMLDGRRQRIAEGLDAVENARVEASEAQSSIEGQLDEARQQSQEILANAQQIATRIQEESRSESERNRETALERATQEISLERDRAISELRGEFADVTIAATERVIKQSVNRDDHERIIEETFAESEITKQGK